MLYDMCSFNGLLVGIGLNANGEKRVRFMHERLGFINRRCAIHEAMRNLYLCATHDLCDIWLRMAVSAVFGGRSDPIG